jgi:hypothetical protein
MPLSLLAYRFSFGRMNILAGISASIRAVHLIGELFSSSLIFSIKKCHQIRSYLTGHYGIVRITFQGGPILKHCT